MRMAFTLPVSSLIRGESCASPRQCGLGSRPGSAPTLLLTLWMLLPSCQESRAHSPSGCL